jgi:hypothetical protein
MRKILQSRYTLFFVNGFLLASVIFFYMEDSYEQQLFKAMADYVNDNAQNVKNNNEDSVLLQSLHLTYYLERRRSAIFGGREFHTLKSSFIHPITYDLMTAQGACGSYAAILSRLLNELKIPNRIPQMKVKGSYGGHILVEAKTAKGWVVLDGTYDLYFKKPDGSLASFADVEGNWDFYRNQVPANYDTNYRYEGVRYTNWNKIPVIMPALKNILYLFMGRGRTESFSIRTLFLRKYHVLFEIAACLYILLVLIVVVRYIRKNRNVIITYLPLFKRTVSISMDKSVENRA